MDKPADSIQPPSVQAEAISSLSHQLEQLLLQQHPPLATLKLAAYAADAFRVLRLFDLHANVSPSFDASLRTACQDWRNPGSIDDPADLIAVALIHVIAAVQELFRDLAKVSEAMKASNEAP